MHSSNDSRAASRLAWTREALGDASAALEPASSDASFRSYWRTHHDGRSLIVMDAPPPQEDVRPWLDIDERLREAGLNAPEVFAENIEDGFLLIADLGEQLYLPALNDGNADALYGDALRALLRMQTRIDARNLPVYDAAFLRREMQLLPEWFLGRHLGHSISDAEHAVFDDACETIVNSALEQPYRFVHRDYHSRNLLVVDAAPAEGPEATWDNPGIIDFQGAMLGPITYDLASLLRDCYIRWDDARVEAWVAGYRRQLREAKLIDADVDAAHFQRWFDLIGLQRHIKVLGLFCRLALRDGKQAYLADLPRVLDYVLDVAACYDELGDFAELLHRCSSRDQGSRASA